MPVKFLHNLYLVDFKNSKVNKSCILILNNKIFKIIKDEFPHHKIVEYFRSIFSDFKSYNLGGGYVIPGFNDSHVHLLAHGIEKQRIDLGSYHSLDECLQKLGENKKDEILFGVNWDESNWQKGKIEDLNRKILDKISVSNPVIMRRVCGHFAVCNSRALEFISPKWKIVDRNTGYLYEDAALYLNQIFKPTIEMYEKGLEIAMREALSLGITSINEITDLTGFKIYQRIKKKLKIRVALYIQKNFEQVIKSGLQSNFGDDFLKFNGVKLFMDGSIGAKTAAVSRPYKHSKSTGKILISKERLIEIIKKAEENSIQLMIHSIGDRATDIVLEAFKTAGIKDNRLRHRLEHLEILTDYQIEEIKRLALIASMQPNFLRWQSPGNMYEKNLGIRYKQMNCFKKIKEAGIKLIFGSDCMPLGPFYGINYVINSPFSAVRLTPAEAINLYTTTPSYATFDEDKKGGIEEGNFADLVVLDKNPLKVSNIAQIKILMTIVDGKLVYINREIPK